MAKNKQSVEHSEKNDEMALNLKVMLEKKIELEKLKLKSPFWKKVVFIFVGIAAIAFLAFSCFMMYKQSFTMETLLTVLLSFFSIGLSIMFYIQSEKSSSTYYNRSYEIMKDVSVALGKIEAGFGEKLANIKSDLEKFDPTKITKKIEEGEKKQEEIREKLKEGKLADTEKDRLFEKLKEITEENVRMRNRLEMMERRHMRDVQRYVEGRRKIDDLHPEINNFRAIRRLIDDNEPNEE